jgi:pseudaminic acid cytidylyltransferase
MRICIIPARGGSKRIAGKNLLDFCGKPVICYSIEAAMTSGLFDNVIVSTDNEQIVQIASQYGALVPFVRPEALADDYTPTIEVIRHAIHTLEQLGRSVSSVCCVYPASPLIQSSDLKLAFDMLRENKNRYVFPVTEFSSVIYRALEVTNNLRVKPIFSGFEHKRSQDLTRTYHDAGQFYWASSATWNTVRDIHSNGVGLVVPRWRVVDIDTMDDWKMCEIVYEGLRAKNDKTNQI